MLRFIMCIFVFPYGSFIACQFQKRIHFGRLLSSHGLWHTYASEKYRLSFADSIIEIIAFCRLLRNPDNRHEYLQEYRHPLVAYDFIGSRSALIGGKQPVHVAIRRYHLRLKPQTELHFQFIHLLAQAFSAIRKCSSVYDPVAKGAVVAIAF